MRNSICLIVLLAPVFVLVSCDVKPSLDNLVLGKAQSPSFRQGKDYSVPDYSKYPPNNVEKPDPFTSIKDHFRNKFPSLNDIKDSGDGALDNEGKKAVTITAVLLGSLTLIVLGLILVFPAISFLPPLINIPKNRRKRDMADGGEDLKTRVQNIFMAVVQSEECMEKVICEVEALAGEQYKDYIHSLAKKFTPTRFARYLHAFKEGKNSVHCQQRKCTLAAQE